MKKLYEFHWDCGRMGSVDGLFIADESEVEAAIGKHMYFGEILGKFSEIEGTLRAKDIKVKSDDQDFIAKFIEIMGDGTISGYSPLDHLPEEFDEEDRQEPSDSRGHSGTCTYSRAMNQPVPRLCTVCGKPEER